MAPEERDAFEEHFFCCKICGEAIQTGSLFVENVKTVFRDETVVKEAPASKRALIRRGWSGSGWLTRFRLPVMVPAFAALALAGIAVYQKAVVIPMLTAPRSMADPLILDGETRGSLPKKEAGKPLRFQMVLPHTPEGEHVLVEVDNASGTAVRKGSVEVPDSNQPLDVYFPGRLNPGNYSLVARSEVGENAGQEMARNSFEIVEPLNIPTEIAVPAPRTLEPPKGLPKRRGGR
jgi:hypothetical protein